MSEKPEQPPFTGPDEIGKGIAELVEATLGVGSSLARAFAKATSEGEVPAPPSDRAIDGIVHYGTTSVLNVVRMFTSGLTSKPSSAGAATPRASASAAASSSLPTVRRGGTLRVPLSVENPAAEPMKGLVVRCVAVDVEDGGAGGRPVAPESVRLVPERLDIAPRDFEKLTVFVDTEADHALGTYVARICIGSEDLQTTVPFVVAAG